MSTKPRIVAPGVIYHVFSIGVQELQIFKKDEFSSSQLAKL